MRKGVIIVGFILLVLISSGCIGQSEPEKQEIEPKPEIHIDWEDGDSPVVWRVNNYGEVGLTGCEVTFEADGWGEDNKEWKGTPLNRVPIGRIPPGTITDDLTAEIGVLPPGAWGICRKLSCDQWKGYGYITCSGFTKY